MKALLLKDWYVLRKQVWSYLLIVLVWGLIPSLTLNLLAVVYGAMDSQFCCRFLYCVQCYRTECRTKPCR